MWLVTGAPGGLGQPLISKVLTAGERVIAATREDKPLQPPASALPGRLRTVSVDITDAGTLRPVLDDAITGFGRLDVIVNNAGYTPTGPFEELDDAGAARTDFRANWASRLPGSAALRDYLPVHDALARSADTAARQVGAPARTVQTLAGIGNAHNDQFEDLGRFATLSASTDHTKAI
ncbi:SDR family NAD(P)-dependent oxidoreductase [Streptomyces rochei]|uniref:SDR family NAD(P)-dependent oxidoreductase n=1 Tax=Streptomyces rochei TaxID=1928 RepID=UPI0036738D94